MGVNGTRILVTGGLGFIGSNLAVRLVREGARVTVIDGAVEGCGANRFNLNEVRDDVEVIEWDIGDVDRFRDVLRQTELVFNLAGEISHTRSMKDPLRDITLNTISQLKFLLELKKHRPGVRVVYAGTRQVYGKPKYLPIDEEHPVQPVDFNGIHKFTTTHYHYLLSRLGEIDAVTLRLTNVYGPRMALNLPAQGFIGQFLRRSLEGEPMTIFGDGNQLRDPLYVDDAVEAFMLAGFGATISHRSYNVGGSEALRVGEIASILARRGGCRLELRPFPADHKAIDIGSFYTDSSKFKGDYGWAPMVEFSRGIEMTLEYFRAHRNEYCLSRAAVLPDAVPAA